MDKKLIEKYKNEIIKTYAKRKDFTFEKVKSAASGNIKAMPENDGALIVVVTAVRSLYPIENARVTVFSGENESREDIVTVLTDESGKTEPIYLSAPDKQLSLESENKLKPYSEYNIEVKAEGYVDSVFLNVPVFDGITSLQRANMLLLETAGEQKGPIIYNVAENADL